MTAVDELVAAPVERPGYDIVRAAVAEFTVLDLDESERFYVDVLGLIVSERTPEALYLRGWEERSHHSLVLRRAPVAGVARLSFRVRDEDDLEALRRDFEARGCDPRFVEQAHAGMGRSLQVRDPFGFPLSFFCEMAQFDTQLQRFHEQRGAPVARIDHFNLHSPDCEKTFAFWKSLGFRCTEYISTDGEDERITGAWLARKPSVHDVALTAGRGPRLHHLGFTVPDTSSCCARATSSPRPATRRASSAALDDTGSRTPSSSTSATPRATASSCTPATTTPAIPTTGRCAGPPRIHLPFVLGITRARPLVHRVVRGAG